MGNAALSRDVLCYDIAAAVNAFFGPDVPPIALIGHSLGGAIAVHLAHRALIPSACAPPCFFFGIRDGATFTAKFLLLKGAP